MTGPLIVAGLLALVAVGVFLRKKGTVDNNQPTDLPQDQQFQPKPIYNSAHLTQEQDGWAFAIEKQATAADMNAAFMIALAVTESSLNPKAVGDDGLSMGLFQLNKNFVSASDEELLNGGFNIEAALEKMRLLMRSWPGNSYGDYAEAWTLGGAGRFKKNRRNPAKWTSMQKAIDDLSLDLYLTEKP
jgi:hypothetical protein